MLLLSLIMEATFYNLNVNLRKAVGSIVPNTATWNQVQKHFVCRFFDIKRSAQFRVKLYFKLILNIILRPDAWLDTIAIRVDLFSFNYRSDVPNKKIATKKHKERR